MSIRLYPEDLVVDGKNLVCDVFIETGTKHGTGVRSISALKWKTIHSIEYDERNYNLSKVLDDGKRIFIHRGSSPDILKTIIDTTKETLFWLDAHYMGEGRSEMDPTFGECPLLQELAVIKAFDWDVIPNVLIDDAHMFTNMIYSAYNAEQWPTLEQISSLLPTHAISVRNNIIYCLGNENAK